MITNFQIFERLGYNEEVSKLAEYVWSLYKQGEREIDVSNITKNMSFFINKIIIEEYVKNIKTRMTAYFTTSVYYKTKNVKIKINKFHKPTLMDLEHEIKHFYDDIVAGGFLKSKDSIKFSPFNVLYAEDDEILDTFFYIMYIINLREIQAYYHSDMRNFKKNKHKFNNNIRKFLKYCRLQENLDFLNKNNIKDIINKISIEDKKILVKYYYTIRSRIKIEEDEKFNFISKLKLFGIKVREFLDDYDIINIKNISESEIDKFFNKLEKEVEKKKKVYLKYIGRLYAYFN
jgi:hypothetical protein